MTLMLVRASLRPHTYSAIAVVVEYMPKISTSLLTTGTNEPQDAPCDVNETVSVPKTTPQE